MEPDPYMIDWSIPDILYTTLTDLAKKEWLSEQWGNLSRDQTLKYLTTISKVATYAMFVTEFVYLNLFFS